MSSNPLIYFAGKMLRKSDLFDRPLGHDNLSAQSADRPFLWIVAASAMPVMTQIQRQFESSPSDGHQRRNLPGISLNLYVLAIPAARKHLRPQSSQNPPISASPGVRYTRTCCATHTYDTTTRIGKDLLCIRKNDHARRADNSALLAAQSARFNLLETVDRALQL